MGIETYPVDASGNMLRNVERRYKYNWDTGRGEFVEVDHIKQPNDPFTARLTYDGYWRGSSAICFEWRDELGRKYPMFMTDMNKLVANGAVINGAVWGKWKAVKRGRYYGIQLIQEDS